MKKLFIVVLFIILTFIAGCSKPQDEESGIRKIQLDDYRYITRLSPDGQITIVRNPFVSDFSKIHPSGLSELPTYDPDSGDRWQVDLRSTDLTGVALGGKTDDLLFSSFDSKTKWPEKLPDGFDPEIMMELGKNPGLGIKKLHQSGITGKGVGLAIIDQGLLVDHVEYKDQLRLYEEIHSTDYNAAMHGPAVASIAVGKSVGVAPEAALYYIAETHGTINGSDFDWDLSWLALSIDRIVEINKMLPEEGKIRVISFSLGLDGERNGYEKVLASIEAAKEERIYTVYVASEPYFGLGREPMENPNEFSSYGRCLFLKRNIKTPLLMVPMDSRCTASPTGENDYVFYREGGMSWTAPYVAGLYALACQVKPDVTPELFWKAATETSVTLYEDNSDTEVIGKIIDPAALLESFRDGGRFSVSPLTPGE